MWTPRSLTRDTKNKTKKTDSKSINNVVVIWKPVIGNKGRRGIAHSEDKDGVVPLRELVLNKVRRKRGATFISHL